MLRIVVHVFVINLLILGILFSCQQEHKPANPTMQQILASVADTAFYQPDNIYANQVRVAYYDSLLRHSTPYEKNNLSFRLAVEKLNAGQTKEAIELLEPMYQVEASGGFVTGLDRFATRYLDDMLALAYLRLGEQQNCIENHSSSACIIPISDDGLHKIQDGSSRAIEVLNGILAQDPGDLTNRWLLNLAHMTLDQYPEKVPENYLIPPGALASEYPLKKFTDLAPQTNLAIEGLAGGCVVDDFNQDGFYDLIVSEWHPDGQLRYYINDGSGNYLEMTIQAGLEGLTGGTNLVQGDYNNDGLTDIFVMRGGWLYEFGRHPNSLLRNNGDNTFTDVTIESGLLSYHPSQTAVWADFNNDGWLDLFVGNESEGADIHPCELFINNGQGKFNDKAAEAGVAISTASKDYFVKGVTAGDYNRDGWIDLYISAFNSNRSNLLLENQGFDEKGRLKFADVTRKAGLYEELSTFPTWFWDYNNDGWPDIFVAGYLRSNFYGSIAKDIAAEYLGLSHEAATARIYQNNGDGTFTNKTNQAGMGKIAYAMGANFGDLDNDGWLDMYLSTGEVNLNSVIPNRMFRNKEGKIFQDVTSAGGFGHIQKGHAVAFADLDQDGDQDIYTVMGGAYEGDIYANALFQNPYQDQHNWIALKLIGNKANRSAIGSSIRIVTDGNPAEIYREINSGGSFGASPLRAEIGLGNATKIKSATITWAGSGKVQELENLEVNRIYQIREGEKEIKVITPNQMRLQQDSITLCLPQQMAKVD